MDHDVSGSLAQRIASRTAQLSLNSSSAYPYEDVTALLENATKDMKTGQLIQMESFSLFDAMCAIVIMDPKMDTGMILDDYATRPQYNVNRLLDPKEFIWIFDNILMTWLSGHALSQTLFTSCYVLRLLEIDLSDDPLLAVTDMKDLAHPPTQLVSVVLKACVLAVAKSCALIWDEMKKGQVYEEEDFMANKFGVSLYENYSTSTLVTMLDVAELWTEDLGKKWIEAQYGDEASDLYKGVLERIRYARSSFMALFQVAAPNCSQFSQAVPQLEVVRSHVQVMKSTHKLGVAVDDAFDHTVHRKLVTNTPPRAIALLSSEETFAHLDQMCEDLMLIGQALSFPDAANLVNFFIHFAAKKPAPGAYPRSILQSVLYDDRILMGFHRVQDVVRDSIQDIVAPSPWIFESVSSFPAKLEGVSVKKQLSRSSVLNSGSQSRLNEIPELQEDEDGNMDDDDDDELSVVKRQLQFKAMLFVDKAVKPFVDTLQIAGQNTSRQRRNLRKMVLLWEALQEEAEGFDEEIHLFEDEVRRAASAGRPAPDAAKGAMAIEEIMKPFYFVSWVYHMKLWVMEWLLLLGFELELYSTFEYSMVYGYTDCVMGAHAQHLRRVQTVIESQPTADSKTASQSKSKKKKKKKAAAVETESTSAPKPAPVSVPALTVKLIEPLLVLETARLHLARATFLVLAALTEVGHLSTTPAHLASHGLNDLETLHRHRFKAFHHLSSPETMNYENFLHRLGCDGLD
ncbi:hypothetical protein BGZ58_002684, partial [Dissophora ornata]